MQASDRIVIHSVGGVGIAVTGDYVLVDERRSVLVTSPDSPELIVTLTASRATTQSLRPNGTPAAESDAWIAFLDEESVQLCVKDGNQTPPEPMRIELPRNGLQGRYIYRHDWPYMFQYPIDQLLVIHALGVAGGALMHAASIAGRDGALLVVGQSGAGKTTMSRAAFAEGAHVLSDERTIVRPAAGGGWLVGGTPWPGEGGFAENRTVPLRGVILLEQAERDELLPLSGARAVAMLYRCHFPPLWDPVACERTVDNLERLVREVPTLLFRNRKGREAAQTLLARVGGVA